MTACGAAPSAGGGRPGTERRAISEEQRDGSHQRRWRRRRRRSPSVFRSATVRPRAAPARGGVGSGDETSRLPGYRGEEKLHLREAFAVTRSSCSSRCSCPGRRPRPERAPTEHLPGRAEDRSPRARGTSASEEIAAHERQADPHASIDDETGSRSVRPRSTQPLWPPSPIAFESATFTSTSRDSFVT